MTPANNTKAIDTSGRDAAGRFTSGNLIGPGRPKREREREYTLAFASVVTATALAEMTVAILAKAKKGDVPAARLLYEYALGKPVVRIEFAEEESYRVAGMTPAAHMEQMMSRIQAKVQERREYEAQLAAEAKPPISKGRKK